MVLQKILDSVQEILWLPPRMFVLLLLFGYTAYLCALAIYRVYFSPLAKVPGPRLAAITEWYETYFELFKGIGGQYTFQIQKLHKKYGPVVRINPHEVHIHDPEFFNTIYTTHPGYDQPSSIQYRFGAPHAVFSTPEHGIHRQRRAAIVPFFSKQKILQQSPLIQEKVDKLCSRLTISYAGRNKAATLNHLFTCHVADVIVKYAFNESYNFLDKPNFQSPFIIAIRGFKDMVHPAAQFYWLPRIMIKLPDWLVKFLQPSMATVIQFRREMRGLINGARSAKEVSEVPGKEDEIQGTIFDGILGSSLPPQELSIERLKDEAVSIIGAGIASAEWTCTLACFHIINDAQVQRRLKDELLTAIPDPQQLPSLKVLESLPYLMACVEESVHLACGQIARSPRISRTEPIKYGSWTFPPGTPVSMDTWHMHHDESIYEQSFKFIPERWLGNPRGPDGAKYLNRYMTSFGKGTRICLGMNLAYAEITMVIAALFRRFNFELFETDYEDIRVARVVIAPDPHPRSKGVQVIVK